jgi:hypothetical protein
VVCLIPFIFQSSVWSGSWFKLIPKEGIEESKPTFSKDLKILLVGNSRRVYTLRRLSPLFCAAVIGTL